MEAIEPKASRDLYYALLASFCNQIGTSSRPTHSYTLRKAVASVTFTSEGSGGSRGRPKRRRWPAAQARCGHREISAAR